MFPPGVWPFHVDQSPPPARQQVETKRSASCKPSGSDLPRYCNHDICFQLKFQSPKPPPLRALYQQTRGPLFTPRAPSAHRKEAGPLYPALHRKPRIITTAKGPNFAKAKFRPCHLQVQPQLRSLLQELNTHRGASQAHLRRPLHGPWPSLQSLRPQTRHKAPGPCANSEKPIPKKVVHPPAVPNRMAFLSRPTSTPSTSSSFKLAYL